MKKKLLIVLLSFSYIYASNNDNAIKQNENILNKIEQTNEQKDIFNQQKKNLQNVKENKTYEMQIINVKKDEEEDSCIKIEKINVKGSSIFSNSSFEGIIQSYLNNCNGIKNLTNLVNKISNMYIEKGYVTSRAYLKAQDLTDGIIDINVLEGKIEDVSGKNIYIPNLYSTFKNTILNIRDLEIAIQQAERLRSQTINFKLLPGSKVGYTKVEIEGEKKSKPYYGDFSLNNFGSKNTGIYQVNTSFTYENLFGLSDILTLRANGTNHINKNTNKNLGSSISYSIPYKRLLVNFSYSYSKYKQINKDEFNTYYKSDGKTKSYNLSTAYKIFHSKNESFELLNSFEYKKNENFFNEIKLDIQSYKLSIINIGLKHSYKTNDYNYYSLYNAYSGIAAFGAAKGITVHQESKFKKYTMDLGVTKYFKDKNDFKYDFSLRAQYSKNILYGSEEISIGGPYSVRGFKKTGLSGNTGFYIRNELSFSKSLSSTIISPYLAVDFGYIRKKSNNIYGNIIGSAIGLRFNSSSFYSFETFYTKALKDAKVTKDRNKNFFGLKLSFNL